ncbi:MAG: hypothetical protein ACE5FJ_08045 [Gemmatimonadales bacterium]
MASDDHVFDLKEISADSIDSALQKAERYRLLNEPSDAESICLDILAVDETHQEAIVCMVLAITDQFGREEAGLKRARDAADRLENEYKRAYYNGIICERRGKSLMTNRSMGTGPAVYDWLREAMDWFEKARATRPPGDDSATLRWNSCARFIMDHSTVRPAPQESAPTMLE